MWTDGTTSHCLEHIPVMKKIRLNLKWNHINETLIYTNRNIYIH